MSKQDEMTREEYVLSGDLRNRTIPVGGCEERKVAEQNDNRIDKTQDFYIQELQRDLSKLNGALFGQSGQGGALNNITVQLQQLAESQDEMRTEMRTQIRQIADEHRAEISEMRKEVQIHEVRIEKTEKDIGALHNKQREIEGVVDAKQTRWRGLLDHVLKVILAAAALGLFTAFGAWVWSMIGG